MYAFYHAHLYNIYFNLRVPPWFPDVDETIGYDKQYCKYPGWMTGVTLYAKLLGVEIWDGLSAEDRKELKDTGYEADKKNFRINYDQ